jgi:glutamate N-acetyltransferase/amino-acid N-acetyltransferase
MKDYAKMGFDIIKDGSITSVPGFFAGSSHCGLKNSGKKPDICIIYIPVGSTCSGVFTTNSFKAAPVILDSEVLDKNNIIKAVTVNSGIANACTGKKGMDNAVRTQKITGEILGIAENGVLVASTGVIGKQLPMDKVEKGLEGSASSMSPEGGGGAAAAILTTDLVEKKIAVSIALEGNKKITIGGIAKGSGMIQPNMATMLAFLGTDAGVEKEVLDEVLSKANEKSFNSITVDGCQSTNDTVLLMANGESGLEIKKGGMYYDKFSDGVSFVMQELAKKIVMDGEGATKFIEIDIQGAVDDAQAKQAAMSIANSNLFKTAIFGEDLNWGRINAALGSSDCNFNPEKVDIFVGDVKIVENGAGLDAEKHRAEDLLKNKNICFSVQMKNGNGCWTVWTSDLSFDYIKINALYHT